MQQNIEDNKSQRDESTTNTKDHIILVENILNQSEQLLMQYKNDINVLKNDINLMKSRIENNNSEIKDCLIPAEDNLQRELMIAVTCQKDENNRQQAHSTQLKKECYQIQQLILQSLQKVAFLEEQVGNYR